MLKNQPRPLSRAVVPFEAGRPLSGIMDAAEPRSLVDFIFQLWGAKWILLGIVAACVVSALFIGVMQTPLYRAQTSLQVQDLNDKFLDSKAPDSTDTTGLETYLQTQVRIALSRSLIERTLSRLPPAERVRLVEPPRFAWSKR